MKSTKEMPRRNPITFQIRCLKSFELGRASKQPGFSPGWAKLQLYIFYIADLLVHDINKVKRLH